MQSPTAVLFGRTAAVITASDRCAAGVEQDLSGPRLAGLLQAAGATVVHTRGVPDEREELALAMREAARQADLVLTTGGTGLAERDVTPEATLSVCDRLVPGIAELLRMRGAEQTQFSALGRGVCGIAGRTLIVNLPGSHAGAESGFAVLLPLLPHALELLAGNTEHRS
jgi:molybdenum cofactor synthesis domain-containing protein